MDFLLVERDGKRLGPSGHSNRWKAKFRHSFEGYTFLPEGGVKSFSYGLVTAIKILVIAEIDYFSLRNTLKKYGAYK